MRPAASAAATAVRTVRAVRPRAARVRTVRVSVMWVPWFSRSGAAVGGEDHGGCGEVERVRTG
ncbi:hypothetical protein GCM10010305_09550 [Streptomyces termitum]|uniref:Uncharacterized protein n=1 Tax=Streptomyces termitum TaxID=67368 RepID=A0A918W6A8_9ACTN|nr:hypothetical protein GCM10010305_09550 [Streptomyces termitum]